MYLRYLIAVLAFVAAPAAKADYWLPRVDIVCSPSENVALVRFGGSWSGGPSEFRRLPRRVDAGLSRARSHDREDCALPNGWRLRVRGGAEQAFAYGAGGADPPAFFSLWIQRRRIFSAKEWKPGYGPIDPPRLTGLVIRPNRLTWCSAREKGPQHCTGQGFRLGPKYRIDLVEYPAGGRKPKVGSLAAIPVAAPPEFCRSYIKVMRARMFDDVAMRWAMNGHPEAPFAWNLFEQARPIKGTDVRETEVAIAPGIRRRILLWQGGTHYFDGDAVMAVPMGVDAAKLVRQVDFPDGKSETITIREAPGWSVLTGGRPAIYPAVSARYVHFVPERIRGRLYFLARPTNIDERPTALLIGLRPEGGVRVMCRIQRVEPHF